MRFLLLVLLFLAAGVPSVWAKTYSCRDKDGQMHFADNLQGLPEECLGKEKELKPGTADNLNFVPSIPAPPQPSAEFRHSVRDVERKLQQTEQQRQNLQTQAEKIVASYQQAGQEKRQATRRWSYESRSVIKKADTKIARARAYKQQVLQELAASGLASQEKKRLRELLNAVADE